MKKLFLGYFVLTMFLVSFINLCGMEEATPRKRSSSFSDFESIKTGNERTYNNNYTHEFFTRLFNQVSKEDFEVFDVVIESALVDFILFIETRKASYTSLQNADIFIEKLIKRAIDILKKEDKLNKDGRLNKFVDNFNQKVEKIFWVERSKKLKGIVSKYLEE